MTSASEKFEDLLDEYVVEHVRGCRATADAEFGEACDCGRDASVESLRAALRAPSGPLDDREATKRHGYSLDNAAFSCSKIAMQHGANADLEQLDASLRVAIEAYFPTAASVVAAPPADGARDEKGAVEVGGSVLTDAPRVLTARAWVAEVKWDTSPVSDYVRDTEEDARYKLAECLKYKGVTGRLVPLYEAPADATTEGLLEMARHAGYQEGWDAALSQPQLITTAEVIAPADGEAAR